MKSISNWMIITIATPMLKPRTKLITSLLSPHPHQRLIRMLLMRIVRDAHDCGSPGKEAQG